MAHVLGHQGKAGIGDTSTVDQPVTFTSESFRAVRPVLFDEGIRGTRSKTIGQTRYGPRSIEGQFVCRPNAKELVYLLPWILGGTASGTTYPLAETVPEKYLSIDRVQKVFLYDGVRVARATFTCNAGQPLMITLDLLGLTETVGNAGTHPSLSYDTTTRPFVLTDAAIAINSVSVCAESITVTVDNVLQQAPMTNCQVGPAALLTTDRIITLEVQPGYGDHSALYPPVDTGWVVDITWTDGTVSLSMDFISVVFDQQAPTITGRASPIMLPLRGQAFETSSTKELVVTLDSTV